MKDEEPMGLFTPSHVSDTMAAWVDTCRASNMSEKDRDFIILQKKKQKAYHLKWYFCKRLLRELKCFSQIPCSK